MTAPPIKVGQVKRVAIDSIRPHPANARVHDLPALRASVRDHGAFNVIGVQKSRGRIVYGEGRWRAMKAEGMTKCPVVELDLTDAEALEVLAVDNGSHDAGGYDDSRLLALLERIRKTADPIRAGYSPERINATIERLRRRSDDDPARDETGKDPIRPPERPVTRPGDVWLLGDHRIMCGDARKAADVKRLLGSEPVNVAVTSPPYADRREYDAKSGFKPVPPDEYVAWFAPVARHVAAHLAPDGSWFVNIKPGADGLDTELYVHDLVAAHVREWGWHFATEFCWERNGVPKSVTARFKNQFEPVYQFVRDRWKIRPANVQLWSDHAVTPFGPGAGNTSWKGDQGGEFAGPGPTNQAKAEARAVEGRRLAPGSPPDQRARRNDECVDPIASQGENWQPGEYVGPGLAYPGNRLPTFAGSHEATGHAAAFPVGLPAWFIKAYSDPGDNVFDPFTGSGSTLLAAHEESRVGFGLELSPAYVDVICQRFERSTGIVPVLEATGKARTFDKPRKAKR